MFYTQSNKQKKRRTAQTVKKVIVPKQDEVSIKLKLEAPKVRCLKIKAFYRQSSKIVPEIRLCGKWLQEAGFIPNEYVNITVMNNLLLIRSAQKQTE